MNVPRMVLNRSAVLQQLFAIQDAKRMPNNELAARTRSPRLSPDRISDLRRALYKKSSIEHAESIAEALGYEIVIVPKTRMPQTAKPMPETKKPPGLRRPFDAR